MTTQKRRIGTLAFTLAFAMSLMASTAATAVAAGAVPAAAPSGSYAGSDHQNGYGFTFYVSANRTQLQDISIPAAVVTCLPGGSTAYSALTIATVPLKANGSFNITTTERGQFQGFAATFTHSFQGSVHNAIRNAPAGGAGVYRENVVYNDGTQRNCTSNNQAWTATRASQATQTNAAPPSGSYAGTDHQNGYGFTFYVSANRTQLQDLSIPASVVTCLPGGSTAYSALTIATVPLKAHGSFNITTTERGQFQGFAATFTHTFQGNLHSLDQNGVERAAGMYHETVTYNDGTQRNCTSNNQSWYAARDAQAAQATTAPPPGSYAGTDHQNGYGFRFSVASRTLLKNVSIPNAVVTCVPGGSTAYGQFVIGAVPLKTNGSFNTTTTSHGQFNGFAATFTFTFQGNFHSLDQNGVERAAGMYRENVTYTNGTQINCTSNNQAWYAIRSGN